MDQPIVINGTSRQDLNGKHGIATDYHPVYDEDREITSQSRYTVLLDSGEQFKVKEESVWSEDWQVVSPLLGQRVEDVADGQRGRAVMFKPGEYRVQFDGGDGELLWVMAANLRAEPTGRAKGGARAKAKGKGKKGRGKGGK